MRSLVFDLDGTLLSCRERQVAVAVHVAGPLDEPRFWRDKRAGATTAAALRAQGIPDPDSRAQEWVAAVEEPGWLRLDRPVEDAAAALAAARAAGMWPAVLTARRHSARVRDQVGTLGLDVDRVVVVSPREAAAEKALALGELDAAGFVGDTESDLAAAQRAGVPFAAVSTGQRDARFLSRHGAAEVHGSLLDAVRALTAFRG